MQERQQDAQIHNRQALAASVPSSVSVDIRMVYPEYDHAFSDLSFADFIAMATSLLKGYKVAVFTPRCFREKED